MHFLDIKILFLHFIFRRLFYLLIIFVDCANDNILAYNKANRQSNKTKQSNKS